MAGENYSNQNDNWWLPSPSWSPESIYQRLRLIEMFQISEQSWSNRDRRQGKIVAHCHYHDNFSQLISSHDLIISNLTDDLTNLNHCGFDWLSWYLTTLNMAASFPNCMPSKWYCVLCWCVASFRFKTASHMVSVYQKCSNTRNFLVRKLICAAVFNLMWMQS